MLICMKREGEVRNWKQKHVPECLEVLAEFVYINAARKHHSIYFRTTVQHPHTTFLVPKDCRLLMSCSRPAPTNEL